MHECLRYLRGLKQTNIMAPLDNTLTATTSEGNISRTDSSDVPRNYKANGIDRPTGIGSHALLHFDESSYHSSSSSGEESRERSAPRHYAAVIKLSAQSLDDKRSVYKALLLILAKYAPEHPVP